MIHKPIGGIQGQASDIAIHAKQILLIKENLNRILVQHTGQSFERIEADIDRERYLSSEEAREYRLIDKVIDPRNQT